MTGVLPLLRRGPGPTDRVTIPHGRALDVVAGSERLAARLADGTRIYVYIGRIVSGRLRFGGIPTGNSTWRLGDWIAYTRGSSLLGLPGITTQMLRRDAGPYFAHGGPRGTTFLDLVPDGVARVQWFFPPGAGARSALTVGADVDDNVVLITAQVNPWARPYRILWFDRAGRPLRHT